jgi:hypothetical protein
MCNLPVLVMATFSYIGSSTPVADEKGNMPRFNITEEFGSGTAYTDGAGTELEEPCATPPSDSNN